MRARNTRRYVLSTALGMFNKLVVGKDKGLKGRGAFPGESDLGWAWADALAGASRVIDRQQQPSASDPALTPTAKPPDAHPPQPP
jgi:hypothetical protein